MLLLFFFKWMGFIQISWVATCSWLIGNKPSNPTHVTYCLLFTGTPSNSFSVVTPQSAVPSQNSPYLPHLSLTPPVVGLPIQIIMTDRLPHPCGSFKARNKNNLSYIKHCVPASSSPATLCNLSLLNVRSLSNNLYFITSIHLDFLLLTETWRQTWWTQPAHGSLSTFTAPLCPLTLGEAWLSSSETAISATHLLQIIMLAFKSWCLRLVVQLHSFL